MLPVVWTPEANEDLLEARAWYDNIRPQLGERFALEVEALMRSRNIHCNPLSSIEADAVRECGAFPTGYSLRFSGIGSW